MDVQNNVSLGPRFKNRETQRNVNVLWKADSATAAAHPKRAGDENAENHLTTGGLPKNIVLRENDARNAQSICILQSNPFLQRH